MEIKEKKLRQKLEIIKENNENSIKSEVCDSALEEENIKIFFQDLLRYGCVNGQISKLVWYSQTHKFYDKYYDEIEDMRHDFEEITGEPLKINDDLKNWMAWFSFEETSYQIAHEIGLEI